MEFGQNGFEIVIRSLARSIAEVIARSVDGQWLSPCLLVELLVIFSWLADRFDSGAVE